MIVSYGDGLMTEKRFVLVKCVEQYWGIVDKSLESIDQLVLMHMDKTSVSYIVNVLNQLNDENEQLKEELGSFEQVSFTDLCDKSRTVLYMKKENRGLQFKIIGMLDFVKEKGTVTREEIKKWWNGDVE